MSDEDIYYLLNSMIDCFQLDGETLPGIIRFVLPG